MQLPCVHLLIVFEQCEYLQEQELDEIFYVPSRYIKEKCFNQIGSQLCSQPSVLISVPDDNQHIYTPPNVRLFY